MVDSRLERAVALVYDPVALNRNSTRNILHSIGFRRIVTVTAIGELESALGDSEVDLLLCEVSGADGDITGLIHRIRHGDIGKNPFLVIVATAWVSSSEIVKEVIGCGADDLIIRPFSIKQLTDRLRVHVDNRKGFVVTSDYIGPDRRRDPTRTNTIDLITVPNSLKLKVADGADADTEVATQIAKSRIALNIEKMKRHTFQLGIMASFLEEGLRNEDDDLLKADVQKAASVTSDLAKRAHDTDTPAIAEMCRALGGILDAIGNRLDGDKNTKLMNELVSAMHVTLNPDLDAQAHAAELETTIEKIRSRGRSY
jgi:DNA-binding response OmpR family regulator